MRYDKPDRTSLRYGPLMSFWMPPGAFAQLIKLRAAYSAESSWSLATWVAYEGGYFKKYGLDVDLILIRSASTINAALLAGEAPMIQLGGTAKSKERCA